MQISIKQVLDIIGEEQDFVGDIDLSWVMRHGEKLFPDALAVRGSIFNRAGVVTLRYQISGKRPFQCDRCLMQLEQNVQKAFTHTVVASLEDGALDDVFLTAPDGVLVLDEIAGADLQLSLPQVFLCKEDCKGLCPVCGADLNSTNCDCTPESGDSRMAVLKNLLKG
ncbi:MAG: YceD family protein [Candidatus Fimivivens sp.]